MLDLKEFYPGAKSIFVIFSLASLASPSPSRSFVARINASLSVRHATGIRTDVTASGRSERERDMLRPADKDNQIGDEPTEKVRQKLDRDSECERTFAVGTLSENHTHMRDSARLRTSTESAVSFLSAIVPSRPVCRFVGRRAPGLTRTELCHRDAPCYEAVIQRARENMRRAATYASTMVHGYYAKSIGRNLKNRLLNFFLQVEIKVDRSRGFCPN